MARELVIRSPEPRHYELVPQDDMPPIEAVYVVLAIQEYRTHGVAFESHDYWDMIRRRFIVRG